MDGQAGNENAQSPCCRPAWKAFHSIRFPIPTHMMPPQAETGIPPQEYPDDSHTRSLHGCAYMQPPQILSRTARQCGAASLL